MPKPTPPNWTSLKGPVPHTAVQMFVTDGQSLLLIHRSDKVRSVKNLWSFPSGLHDIGEDIYATAARELQEEFNLTAQRMVLAGDPYENMTTEEDPAWHWVIFPMMVRVKSFDSFVNKEPDKHDQILYFPIEKDWKLGDLLANEFHPSFVRYVTAHTFTFKKALMSVNNLALVHHTATMTIHEGGWGK